MVFTLIFGRYLVGRFALTPNPSPPDSATLHSPSAFANAMADKSAGLGSITSQMGEGLRIRCFQSGQCL